MSQSIVFNGLTYTIPDVSDENWGDNLTNFFIALPQGALQKTGGLFTLTADVNFGAAFGPIVQYLKSRSTSISTAGVIRFAVGDTIGFRNNANNGNLLLAVNGSDVLTFNGVALQVAGNYITALTGDVTASGPGSAAASIASGVIVNSQISASAAIAFSKLASLTSAHILVGSSGNVATDVAVSGDISMSNTGVTAYSGTVPINKGGTAATTKAGGFDALSPMTTGGDLIYGGTSGTGTRLANGTVGQFLKSNGTTVAPSWATPGIPSVDIQVFKTGTGTYTTPSNTLYLDVEIVGGGGGGEFGNVVGTDATDGGSTTFGSSLLIAGGGQAGQFQANGGAGGSPTINSPAVEVESYPGGSGQGCNISTAVGDALIGGQGGCSVKGGGGGGGAYNGAGQTGSTNTGGGGGGGSYGGGGTNILSGAGGGAGAYVHAIITTPSTTYGYAVGAAGAAGTSSVGGLDGGAGAKGIIIVKAYHL